MDGLGIMVWFWSVVDSENDLERNGVGVGLLYLVGFGLKEIR